MPRPLTALGGFEKFYDEEISGSPSNIDVPWGAKPYRRVLVSPSGAKPSADDVLVAQISNDNGANFRSGASDYAWVNLSSAAGSIIDNGANADTKMVLTENVGVAFNVDSASAGLGGDIVIVNPEDSSIETKLSFQLGHHAATGPNFTTVNGQGNVNTAERNNAIRLSWRDASTFSAGRVTAWGFFV